MVDKQCGSLSRQVLIAETWGYVRDKISRSDNDSDRTDEVKNEDKNISAGIRLSARNSISILPAWSCQLLELH